MRKFLSLLLTLALLLSLCPAAFAEESSGFVLPVLPDGHPEDNSPPIPDQPLVFSADEVLIAPGDVLPQVSDAGVFDAGIAETSGNLNVSVTESGDYFTGVTWTAGVTGGSGDYMYQFDLIHYVNEQPTYVSNSSFQTGTSNSFSFTFTANEDYELWIQVTDNGDSSKWAQVKYSVPVHVAGHDPLEITVSEEGAYLTGVTWTASVTGGSGVYSYTFYVIHPVTENGSTKYIADAKQEGSSNTFHYTFAGNGEYQLWVDVSDSQGIKARVTRELSVQGGFEPLDFTVTMSGEYFSGVTWTAFPTGGSGSYQIRFELRLPNPSFGNAGIVTCSRNPETPDTLSYTFLASGEYTLHIWLTDTVTKAVQYKEYAYSVSSLNHPTVEQAVNSLVAQCRADGCTGDYETALWLHDWLTANANYDVTYSHYGPDGVLLGGTGVCDSYSKAYMLLLQEAGINADRITNDDHSWNALLLGESWYYVDCTWDDPVASETSAPGGFEHHQYFCIPDEILGMDHPNYSSPYFCFSYEDNYYVHNGDGASWADVFATHVQTALQAGDLLFQISLPDFYAAEGKGYSVDRTQPFSVLADKVTLLLAGRKTYAFGSQPISLNLFKVLNSDARALAQVETWAKTLYLPLDLTEIGPQAFAGASDFMSVDIPARVTKIDSGAFLGCDGLWSVTIPPSVVSFGDNCFDKANPHLTLGVAENSEALEYARTNGFKYTVMDYIFSAAAAAP